MAGGQIDVEADRVGTAWRLVAALVLSFLGIWLVLAGGGLTLVGLLAVIVGLAILTVFGFFAITLAEDAARNGPVVSVGPRGIFDRRVSRDWIGWEWYGDIQLCRWPRELAFVLYLHPGSVNALPLRTRARLLSWVNWVIRPDVRWLFTKQLKADVPALTAAIEQFSGGRFRLTQQLAART